MTLNVRLFPQVVSDLNFFNVSSKRELALRLRTVQRVAAAGIIGYLYLRYESPLAKQLGLKSPLASMVIRMGFAVGSMCLSLPVTGLFFWAAGYQSAKNGISAYRDQRVVSLVSNVVQIVFAYLYMQQYRRLAVQGMPDLLEKLFQGVEDRVTQPIWNRFYKKD